MRENIKQVLAQVDINTLILAGAILLAVSIYSCSTRYQVVVSDRGLAYQVDRMTGESWVLLRDKKIGHGQ